MISSIPGGLASQAALAASRDVDIASTAGDAKPIDPDLHAGNIHHDNTHSGQAATLARQAFADAIDKIFAETGRF